ncbi:RNA 2',3'-cyclic phosphodiesterase [candidate division WWE3 bacterium]|jgi:2'-5' RNA ligase|uniref:RNA 2',3'-cyclic phosphodiesterase n=1 Tax=candidate division WWE3 bacterium TaxID=2053526 RepID=A0A3A4ZFD9_UNCKA|nr:MAG: RNA 2',3'-cyclic phosphodiesterase [candidate division WWE3 bacterium]
MKIFIAIKIDENIKTLFKNLSHKFATHKNLNWEELDNLHMTIIPPWNYPDPKEIFDLLSREFKFKPFLVNFYKIEFGPNKKSPKLLWAVGKPCNECEILRAKLGNILIDKNIAKVERQFLPHITMARLSDSIDTGSTEPILEKINWKLLINKIEILESTNTNGRKEYRNLFTLYL